jgi:hypothetical protein
MDIAKSCLGLSTRQVAPSYCLVAEKLELIVQIPAAAPVFETVTL